MGASRAALKARLILDTGALIALERGERGAFEQLRVMGHRGYLAVVPTMVVMEAIGGARNSQRLLQVLKIIGNELPLAPAISHQAPGLHPAHSGRDTAAMNSFTPTIQMAKPMKYHRSYLLPSTGSG